MRRCTACFRFNPGQPTYCANCGRSFGVRICPRGHHNPRAALYCADCGSADLSVPGPPATLLHQLSGLALYLFAGVFGALLIVMAALSLFYSLDWSAISDQMFLLLLMLGFLYWTTTLIPGPVKKVGKAGWKLAGKIAGKNKRGRHG